MYRFFDKPYRQRLVSYSVFRTKQGGSVEWFIPFLVAGLLAEIMVWSLHRSAKKYEVYRDACKREAMLEYATTLKVASVIFTLAVFVLLLSPFFRLGAAQVRDPYLIYMLLLVFAPVALFIVLEVFHKKVWLSKNGIRVCSAFGYKSMGWDEIEDVHFSAWLKVFRLRSRDGQTILLNGSLSGLNLLEYQLWDNIGETKFRQALPGFKWVS